MSDQPIVLGSAFFDAVLPEVDVPTVERDDGLPRWLVATIGRNPVRSNRRKGKRNRRVQPPFHRESGRLPGFLETSGPTADRRQVSNSRFSKALRSGRRQARTGDLYRVRGLLYTCQITRKVRAHGSLHPPPSFCRGLQTGAVFCRENVYF
jgi:hypothetical protein